MYIYEPLGLDLSSRTLYEVICVESLLSKEPYRWRPYCKRFNACRYKELHLVESMFLHLTVSIRICIIDRVLFVLSVYERVLLSEEISISDPFFIRKYSTLAVLNRSIILTSCVSVWCDRITRDSSSKNENCLHSDTLFLNICINMSWVKIKLTHMQFRLRCMERFNEMGISHFSYRRNRSRPLVATIELPVRKKNWKIWGHALGVAKLNTVGSYDGQLHNSGESIFKITYVNRSNGDRSRRDNRFHHTRNIIVYFR